MMKFQGLIPILLLFLLAGCMGRYVENGKIDDQINVFGVKLLSNVDYQQINGVTATEEPCLRGYERNFDALSVIVGYGFNKKIRRIHTRNPNTSLFGVRPGTSFGEGKQKILQAGFVASTSPFVFTVRGYSITLLVDGDKVFGLTIELLNYE
jgi:hypothetical protein